MNFLAAAINLIPEFGSGLDFLGEFARAIIEGVGILGLGIIVFTLVLKGITLPFDIYQRYKMRKQTLIMKNMKEDLDKLQKQYANDKTTYNMKMQELYKKNGYSMLGACLPMIISLVILIVAFQGFNSYSRYATVQLFVNMKNEYNAAILEHSAGGAEGGELLLVSDGENDIPLSDITGEEKEIFVPNSDLRYTIVYENVSTTVFGEDGNPLIDGEGAKTEMIKTPFLLVEDVSGDVSVFIRYKYCLGTYHLVEGKEREFVPATEPVFMYEFTETSENTYAVDEFLKEEAEKNNEGAEKAAWDKLVAAETEGEKDLIRGDYMIHLGAVAAKEWYTPEHDAHFLWIKNVWYSDASYKNPIPKETVSSDLPQDRYEELTSELSAEKESANGYYILIVLSIGAMALSQFITMRSQKESNQYQTVDGQGATTQKVMLVVMPLIYAVFAFLYSAAFSIYMIVSSLISLLVTVICNLVLGRIFRKKEEEAIKAQYGRTVPWKKSDGKKDDKKRK